MTRDPTLRVSRDRRVHQLLPMGVSLKAVLPILRALAPEVRDERSSLVVGWHAVVGAGRRSDDAVDPVAVQEGDAPRGWPAEEEGAESLWQWSGWCVVQEPG